MSLSISISNSIDMLISIDWMINHDAGNFGKAIHDSQEAIALDASNIKAYFRASKAAAKLAKWEDSLQFAVDGLKACPNTRDIIHQIDR